MAMQQQIPVDYIVSQEKSFANFPILFDQFQPLKPYRLCPVHRFTSINNLNFLMEKILRTNVYSIDTQRSNENGSVTLIHIEIRNTEECENYVLVFEMYYLPALNTPLFYTIKSILNQIFLTKNKIYIWNHVNRASLYDFVRFNYISTNDFRRISLIDLQIHFKTWYQRQDQNKFISQCSCLQCNKFEIWTVEKAINRALNESIEKFHEPTISQPYDINHSVQYCLAITKLSVIVELDWTFEQLYQLKKYHSN